MNLAKSGLIVLGVISIFFITLLATRGTQSNQPNFDLVGQQAPLFAAEMITGGEFNLEDELIANRALTPRDQVWIAVNFFASWCTGCIVEHADLVTFHAESAFSSDGTKCNTKLVSETILIAPSGLVVKKIVGPITYEKLSAGIEC